MTHPQFDLELRVRYDEADPMGFVHHSNYFRYFELCRTEMLRAGGGSYKEVEESGEFVVVVRADVRYRSPARYDDLLNIHLEIPKFGRAKVEHHYTITKVDAPEEVLTDAQLTLAVIDEKGNVRPIPDWMTSKIP